MVGVVELLAVLRGGLRKLALLGELRCVHLAAGGELGLIRAGVDAATAAVIADAVEGLLPVAAVAVDDGAIVVVAAATYVGDGAVVVEVIAVPVAAEEADADVAEAVVDAAVVADVGSPVAGEEAVPVIDVAPVGRGPESAIVGRRAPCAGNPVVATGAPCPVAGGPDVVGVGSGWLVVLGEGRWWLIGLVDGLLVGGVLVFVLTVIALAIVLLVGVALLVVVALLVGVALIAVALLGSVVVVLYDGRGLLLGGVGFALLLRGVGGVGAEDLGGLGGRGVADGCEVAVGCGGVVAVNDWRWRGLTGAALAAGGAEDKERGKAERCGAGITAESRKMGDGH